MLNLDFLEKSLGLDSSPYFLYNFLRKIFLMLYSINWPNLIVRLPLLLEILGNMCIVIVCFPVYNIINCEIKPFSYMSKNSGKNFEYLKKKKSF